MVERPQKNYRNGGGALEGNGDGLGAVHYPFRRSCPSQPPLHCRRQRPACRRRNEGETYLDPCSTVAGRKPPHRRTRCRRDRRSCCLELPSRPGIR
ncbi:MAG: hypothetical protein MZV64_37150 [Ignavibacteriales bacterium]|nr:hypothetical protein [Ignavibacteriales bacterium]